MVTCVKTPQVRSQPPKSIYRSKLIKSSIINDTVNFYKAYKFRELSSHVLPTFTTVTTNRHPYLAVASLPSVQWSRFCEQSFDQHRNRIQYKSSASNNQTSLFGVINATTTTNGAADY